MGLYAPDGSLNVTLTEGSSTEVTTGTGSGVYAPDGSYRVTIVAGGGSDQPALVDGSTSWNGNPVILTNSLIAQNHSVTINLTAVPGYLVLVLPAEKSVVANNGIISTGHGDFQLVVTDGDLTDIIAL